MNMNTLENIPVNESTSGRDLHMISGSKEDYGAWFTRIFGNHYVEGKDYTQQIISVNDIHGNTVNMIDHRLRPHMAMEAVFLIPGITGHAMRRSAIEIMRNWGNIDRAIEWAATLINKASIAGDDSYAKRFLRLCPSVFALQPEITYKDWISQHDEPRTITEIAHDYGLSAVRLNRILESLDVQYRVYGTWRLRPIHDADEYVVKESHGYGDQEGAYHEGYRLRWTQEGQMFIYRQLKAIGIHPRLEAGKHG